MLLNELQEKAKEKPEFDWEKYYEWLFQQEGGRQLSQPHPFLWRCQCGAENASCEDVKYFKCQSCGLIIPARKC